MWVWTAYSKANNNKDGRERVNRMVVRISRFSLGVWVFFFSIRGPSNAPADWPDAAAEHSERPTGAGIGASASRPPTTRPSPPVSAVGWIGYKGFGTRSSPTHTPSSQRNVGFWRCADMTSCEPCGFRRGSVWGLACPTAQPAGGRPGLGLAHRPPTRPSPPASAVGLGGM